MNHENSITSSGGYHRHELERIIALIGSARSALTSVAIDPEAADYPPDTALALYKGLCWMAGAVDKILSGIQVDCITLGAKVAYEAHGAAVMPCNVQEPMKDCQGCTSLCCRPASLGKTAKLLSIDRRNFIDFLISEGYLGRCKDGALLPKKPQPFTYIRRDDAQHPGGYQLLVRPEGRHVLGEEYRAKRR